MKIGKISLVRNINNEAVWQMLAERPEQMSIPEIARTVGLSFPTVNRVIVCGLVNGLITEGEADISAVGRRPQRYKLNADFAKVLCLLVDDDEIYFELKDFCAGTLLNGSTVCAKKNAVDTIAELIMDIVRHIGKVDIAAVSLSGIVDGGVVVRSYRYPYLNGIDVADLLYRNTGVRVILENNMRILGYAAKKTNPDMEQKTVSIIQYGHSGIGCCSIINGEILRGCGGFAGEVGFLPFGERDLSTYDIYEKIMESVISVVAPHKIIVYNGSVGITTQGVVDRVKEVIPDFALPDVIENQNFYFDQIYGLFCMSREYLMKRVSEADKSV